MGIMPEVFEYGCPIELKTNQRDQYSKRVQLEAHVVLSFDLLFEPMHERKESSNKTPDILCVRPCIVDSTKVLGWS
jgi:hypothetical protein